MAAKNPERILIVGAAGSGKNFLGEKLSKITGLKLYDLDDAYFIRKFDKPRPKHLRKGVADRMANRKKWIIVGLHVFDWASTAFEKADLIILLNEKLAVETVRMIRRYLRRKEKGKMMESVPSLLKLIKDNYYCFHHYKGKGRVVAKEIKEKHADKLLVLSSRKEVEEFVIKINEAYKRCL